MPIGPETLHFTWPVSSVTIRAGGSGSLTITAYDGASSQVDQVSGSVSSALAPFTVSGTGIARIVVGCTAAVWYFDDLCFTY